MPLTDPSIPDLLRERAREQPNAPAYTFVDCNIDPSGFSESLTWSEVHRQAQVIAEELKFCGPLVTGPRYSRHRDSTTSSLSSARCRPASSPFRYPCRSRAATTNGFRLRCEIPGQWSSSPPPRSSATLLVTYSPTAAFRSVLHRSRFIGPRITRHRRFGWTRGAGGLPAVHLWVDTYAYRCGHYAPECHRQFSTDAVRLFS